MKSRASFFNITVLRKDLTRFLWAWIAYCAVRILEATSFIGSESHILGYMSDELDYTFNTSLFAIVAVLCLFGDLYDRRMCNGLHALPVRREIWLFTHLISALIFWLVPHILQCAMFIPLLGKDWYVVLFWLLGTTVQYLFYLLLGVVCALCAGRKLSALALYVLTNSLPLLCQWFVTCVYEPVMVGIVIPEDPFYLFSPADFFQSHQLIRVRCLEDEMDFHYIYDGLGSGWWYVTVIGVIAVGLVVLSVQAYRRRPLESIGGLVVFRPVRAALWFTGTLMAGIIVYALVALLGGSIIVVVVGITLSGMLAALILYRNKKRAIRGLLKGAVVAAVVGGSILVVSLDPLGITKWKPAPQDVDYAVISEYFYTNEEDLEWQDYCRIATPADIEKLVNAHGLLILEGQAGQSLFNPDDYGSIYISYHLKDGTVQARQYYYPIHSEAGRAVEPFWQTPEYLLGYEDWDQMLEQNLTAYVEVCTDDQVDFEECETWHLSADDTKGLLFALKSDCEKGVLVKNEYSDIYISLDNGKSFYITSKCRNTTAWLKENLPAVYGN